ncbi:MAG TPA: serine/threonine-protein kinase [Aldersonia sp.]
MLNSGAVIADRYRLQRLIATGGMGQVWEATDNRLDRRVAVKVLKAEFSADPTFRERFRSEARTTAKLNHPGIAGVYDFGETSDPQGAETAYLVMELVRGEPLNAVLGRMGRLDLPHALDMLEQTGRALEVAHEAGIVHRDVKPGNILITPTGQVKITDFGIAKAVDSSPVTKTGMVMGTAQYIAPEQALGQDATAASDVYALGVVGYEALSGQRPFIGEGALTVAMKHVRETPAPLPDDLPANVRELIEITMAKDPTQRYGSGGEFADAVAAVRAGRHAPIPGRPGTGGSPAITAAAARVLPPTGATAMLPTPPPQFTPQSGPPAGVGWTSGQKTMAWIGGALLLIALLGGGWLVLDSLRGESNDQTPTTVRPTTQVTTTAAEVTTTTSPPPVTTTTTEPTTTTTTTETTTTTAPTTPPTTEPTTTTTGGGGITILPPITIPLPGAMGDDETTTTTTHSTTSTTTTTTPAQDGAP